MILPIVGYGDPVLRKMGEEITPEYPDLKETVANMYETMYNAYGVGLAAPQVGLSIRLFVIDTTPFSDDEDLPIEEQQQLKGFKRTFINAKMLKEEGELWAFCKKLVTELNLSENVQFLGNQSPENVADLMESALCFVQHSVTAADNDMEGSPVAVIEAGMAGLPVISTLHAGIARPRLILARYRAYG